MESPDTHARAPIIAAYAPGPAELEPVDFGLAASRVTGAPLVIVAVERGVPLMREVAYDHDEGIARLRETLDRRGIHDPDIRPSTSAARRPGWRTRSRRCTLN